jgi:hypothetical protein
LFWGIFLHLILSLSSQNEIGMKNSIPLWLEFLGMGHGKEATNACRPKRRGDYPSTDTWGWSFPSFSMKLRTEKLAFFNIQNSQLRW